MFDITKINQESPIAAMWAGKEEYLINKYQKTGIYCIKINDKIVYIGKSKDMLGRMYDHLRMIYDPKLSKCHKYDIFREAIAAGYQITFDVMEEAENNEDALGEAEAKWIRQLRPDLNQQIPLTSNWRSFQNNPRAKYVKLKEIITA